MPIVLLTRYECERSRFPPICARCGEPTDDAVRFTLATPATNLLMGTCLSLCPPLAPVVSRWFNRRSHMQIPMCPTDGADWHWRDRVTTWTYIAAMVPTYVAALAIFLL